jgi:hypothetical protein
MTGSAHLARLRMRNGAETTTGTGTTGSTRWPAAAVVGRCMERRYRFPPGSVCATPAGGKTHSAGVQPSVPSAAQSFDLYGSPRDGRGSVRGSARGQRRGFDLATITGHPARLESRTLLASDIWHGNGYCRGGCARASSAPIARSWRPRLITSFRLCGVARILRAILPRLVGHVMRRRVAG